MYQEHQPPTSGGSGHIVTVRAASLAINSALLLTLPLGLTGCALIGPDRNCFPGKLTTDPTVARGDELRVTAAPAQCDLNLNDSGQLTIALGVGLHGGRPQSRAHSARERRIVHHFYGRARLVASRQGLCAGCIGLRPALRRGLRIRRSILRDHLIRTDRMTRRHRSCAPSRTPAYETASRRHGNRTRSNDNPHADVRALARPAVLALPCRCGGAGTVLTTRGRQIRSPSCSHLLHGDHHRARPVLYARIDSSAPAPTGLPALERLLEQHSAVPAPCSRDWLQFFSSVGGTGV